MRYLVAAALVLAAMTYGCEKKPESPKTTELGPPAVEPGVEPMQPAETPMVEPIGPPADDKLVGLTALAPDSPAIAPIPAGPSTYTVRQGDTLWSIAVRLLGDGQRWRDIVAMNPGLVPERMRVGQQIAIPSK